MPLASLAIDASRMTLEHRTGTENYSVEIVNALAQLSGLPNVALYSRSGHPVAVPRGMTLNVSGPSRFWTHVGLSRSMRRDKPDALFVPSHVIPLLHPGATVVTIHDLGYLREPDAHPRRQRIMLDRTTRWNARAARRIIAISGQTRDDLVQHYGVPAAKIEVIHHGVDHQRFRPMGEAQTVGVRGRYGISHPYLLFVSTVQPRKNVVRLVEAFEMVDDPEIRLVIAGKSGWMSEPIERRIAASPHRDRIIRLGHVPDDDLPALYSGAEAFVFPSLFEGLGMGVIEAMAAGTPVVTSRTSSLAEVAGDATVLVDPASVDSIAEGIRSVLKPDVASAYRALGIERARAFSWQTAAEKTLAVIEDTYGET